jgi:hypothetical protein
MMAKAGRAEGLGYRDGPLRAETTVSSEAVEGIPAC